MSTSLRHLPQFVPLAITRAAERVNFFQCEAAPSSVLLAHSTQPAQPGTGANGGRDTGPSDTGLGILVPGAGTLTSRRFLCHTRVSSSCVPTQRSVKVNKKC